MPDKSYYTLASRVWYYEVELLRGSKQHVRFWISARRYTADGKPAVSGVEQEARRLLEDLKRLYPEEVFRLIAHMDDTASDDPNLDPVQVNLTWVWQHVLDRLQGKFA